MNNKLITKAVLLLSGLALTLSAFTACVDDDAFANVESNVAELETAVSGNSAQLKQIETELQSLATSIKATADAAATQAALEEAIDALEAADSTKATQAALTAAKTALEASLAANAEADATTKTELETAIATAKTALENAIATVKATADAAATADELGDIAEDLEGAKAAIKDAYEAADLALSNRIDGLEETLEEIALALTELGDNVGDFAAAFEGKTITQVLQALTADVTALKEAQTVDAFVAGYNLATKILAGDITVDDFGGDQDVYNEYKNYSLATFRATVKLIESRENWYIKEITPGVTEYDAFMDTKDTVEFFLTRAATKEAVKDLFTQFNAHVDGMSTLTELWDDALTAIEAGKLVTEEASSYQTATDIYNAILASNSDENDDNNISVTTNEFIGLKTRYETIVAAQENLAELLEVLPALEDAIAELDEAATPFFLWNYTGEFLLTANDLFDYLNETYLSEDAYVALYNPEIYTLELLLEDNYTILVNARARDAELQAAALVLPELDEDTIKNDILYFGDTLYPERPLWSEVDLITEAKAAIDAWAAEYNIEPANIKRIYTGNEDTFDLEAALQYATDMKTIYVDQAIATLVENIAALNETLDTQVLFTDYAKSVEYRNALNTLNASIVAVTNYSAMLDENYITMVGDVLDAFEDVEDRMAVLKAADDAIQALLADEMNPMVGNVGYQDYPTIDAFLATIADIAETAEIVIPEEGDEDIDPNYTAIIEEAIDVYEALVAEYEAKTALVAEVYTALYNAINGELTLADGNTVWENNKKVIGMPTALGVGNTDIDLTVIIDDQEIETNLKDIMDTWFAFAAEYKAICDEAATEAVAVNDAIVALGAANDLNNYDAIKAVVELYEAWAEGYLADDAIADIQAIKILNTETVYVFVLEANYTELFAKDATADETYEAAEAAFENLDTVIFATAEAWDIHSESDFDAADAAWTNYVDTYYAGAKVADLFEEDAEYATYTDAKADFFAELALAEADRAAIADLIAALPALADIYDGTVTTADAAAAADAVYAAIEAYETAYGCDITACTEWDALTVADQTALKLVAEYAAFVEAYNNSIIDDVDFFNSAYNGFTGVYGAVDTVQKAIDTGIYWNDNLNTRIEAAA